MNCLAFALRVWSIDNDYRIWYNSTHCINLPSDVVNPFPNKEFLLAESFGYAYFANAFKDVLDEDDVVILKKYFGVWYMEIC